MDAPELLIVLKAPCQHQQSVVRGSGSLSCGSLSLLACPCSPSAWPKRSGLIPWSCCPARNFIPLALGLLDAILGAKQGIKRLLGLKMGGAVADLAHPHRRFRGRRPGWTAPSCPPDQRWAMGSTSRRSAPENSWRGRPILYSGSPIISLSCAIQPTVRARAKIAVNSEVGMPMARCTIPE